MSTTLELLKAREAELAAEVERLEPQLARAQMELEAVRVAIRSLDSTFPKHSDTVEAMEAMRIDSTSERRSGAQMNPKLPISKIAKRLGMSLATVSREISENYGSMRTWNFRGQIPEDVQKKLDQLEREHKKRQAKAGK